MVKKQNAMKGELNQRFSFRKLSVGLAGVALSSFWLASATSTKVYADEGQTSVVTNRQSSDSSSTHISQIPDISDHNPAQPGEDRNEYVIYGWGPKTNTEKQLTDQVPKLGDALAKHGWHIRSDDFNQQVSRAITIHYTNQGVNQGGKQERIRQQNYYNQQRKNQINDAYQERINQQNNNSNNQN